MPEADWPQRKHAEVFDRVCLDLERRRARDPAFTPAELEGLLKTAYVNQGNDWVGKGAVSETLQAATIAAYEHDLAEWKKEPPAGPRP